MKLNISTKYALWSSAVNLLVLFTVLLSTGMLIGKNTDLLRERLRQSTKQNFEATQRQIIYSLTEFLRRELFTPLYELDIESIDMALRDLYKGMSIRSARIADVSGKVLTDGKKENLSYGMLLQLDRKRLDKFQILMDQAPSGHRVTFQIGTQEFTAGYGEIIFSDEALQKAIADQDLAIVRLFQDNQGELLSMAVVLTSLVALLAIVVSVAFSRTLSQPLVALRDAALRMAQGSFDHRVGITSRDEIGELASAFNQMGADLQKREGEVKTAAEELQAEIEERRQTERALRETQERLMLAQKAGKVGTFDYDPAAGKGACTGMEELLRIMPGAFEDMYEQFKRRLHPDDVLRIQTELKEKIEAHSPEIEFECPVPLADGAVRWVASTGQIFYDTYGAPRRIIGTAVDVTDMKESQLRLLKSKEAAEAANRAKSEFLANMSHEMRTPLAGALGMVTLVLEMDLGREEREMLEMAKRSAESLIRLISDLLDFSRLEAGILAFEDKPFSLTATIETAIEVVAIQAREKHLQLSVTQEESVPNIVVGDEGRLRQVLVNLLGNAVKFTEKGEIEVRVAPFCDMRGAEQDFLLFSVRDTGIGIPHEQKEKIFGKFVQVDSSSRRKYGGTGLGLALSKQIVEILGGSIWAESEVGRGSTFFFTYPLRRDASP